MNCFHLQVLFLLLFVDLLFLFFFYLSGVKYFFKFYDSLNKMGGLRYSTGIGYSVDLKTLHTFIEMAYFPISISTFGDIQKGNNFENKTILLCL